MDFPQVLDERISKHSSTAFSLPGLKWALRIIGIIYFSMLACVIPVLHYICEV